MDTCCIEKPLYSRHQAGVADKIEVRIGDATESLGESL